MKSGISGEVHSNWSSFFFSPPLLKSGLFPSGHPCLDILVFLSYVWLRGTDSQTQLSVLLKAH